MMFLFYYSLICKISNNSFKNANFAISYYNFTRSFLIFFL